MTEIAGTWHRASYSERHDPSPAAVRIAMEAAEGRAAMGFRGAGTAAEAPKPILLPPEAHVMTFAPTGAGKMVSCVAPVLLQHKGPAIVLDPKGEIAAVTARRRREMGQEVHVIDPFGVSGLATSCFNPLDIIEAGAPDAADEAKVLTNTLMHVMTEPRDAFWRSRAVHLLTAATLSAISDYPPSRRNLSTVRDIVHTLARRADRSAGGSTDEVTAPFESSNRDAQRINDLIGLGAIETTGSIIHTALEGIGFVQGPLVERCLSSSSFRLDDITEGLPLTVYLVLPPHMLVTHGAMLRLWLNTLFSALMRRRTGPSLPTLFVLDEAAQLGPFGPLQTAITLLRGYGVQTWSMWQDASQLAQTFPSGYRAMLNNCRVLEVFGTSSDVALAQLGNMLGTAIPTPSLDRGRMMLLLDGRPVVADRIDYRSDPELAPLADPNPFHAAPTYPLRRRPPSVTNDPHGKTPPHLSAIAEISAALGRL